MAAHLAIWLALCACVAIAPWPDRRIGLFAVILLVLLVPTSAARDFTGVAFDTPSGSPSLSAATWLVLMVGMVQGLTRRHHLMGTLKAIRGPVLLLLAVVLWMGTVTLASRGTHGLSQLVEVVVAPTLFAILLLDRFRDDEHFLTTVARTLLVCAAGLSLLAVAEAAAGRDLIWHGAYAHTAWDNPFLVSRTGYRAPTTLDQPLNTAMFLLIMTPFVLRSRFIASRVVRALAGLILMLGIIATGERTAFVLAVGFLLLSAYAAVRSKRAATLIAAGLILLMIGLLTLLPTGRSLLNRFRGQGESASLRLDGISYLLHHLPSYTFWGRGIGGSTSASVAYTHGPHSFECAYVMMAVDIGILFTVLFVGAMLWLLKPKLVRADAPRIASAVLAMVMSAAYSAWGTKSVAGYLLWLPLAVGLGELATLSPRPLRRFGDGHTLRSVVLRRRWAEHRLPGTELSIDG